MAQEEVVIEGGQLLIIMVSMALIRYCPAQTGCLLLLQGSKGYSRGLAIPT